ncbi:Dynein heavy chain [Phytophthora cinnamomi]|uniref:Dynein heavy chain n=1 Tax=Phytophthora cinnamomi TaxID=4785 RepID=UPI00355961BB|nr:Dynein heavy chain [Phytophthora cinnamomi]
MMPALLRLLRTSTPTRSVGGNGNHHTFSPVVNPVLEKKREAQRESHRAYLKSNSDYNRAEVKYLSIESELRLAEFWLDIVTRNLEDVGKRIEVHDWNFQKITGQDDAAVE